MSDLLPTMRPLDSLEQALLDAVVEAFNKDFRPPTIGYIRWVLRRNGSERLTAAAVHSIVLSMPGIGVERFPARYGPVITGPSGDDGARLSPTVLGLSLANPSMEAAVDRFLDAVKFIGRLATRNEPPLHEEKHTLLKIADLESFFTSASIAEPKLAARTTARLIDNEHMLPVSGGSRSDDYTSWEGGVSQDADLFVDVTTLDDYITALLQLYPQRPAAERPVLVSPLGMHASVDYFNAVWRLAAPQLGADPLPLFVYSSTEAIAKLAFDCGTADEFESRLSGTAQLLKIAPPKGTTPKKGQHPLLALQQLLDTRLPTVEAERVDAAVERLVAVVALRNGFQHGAAAPRAIKAAELLGLAYPVTDHALAWQQVRRIVVESLTAIREELAVFDP